MGAVGIGDFVGDYLLLESLNFLFTGFQVKARRFRRAFKGPHCGRSDRLRLKDQCQLSKRTHLPTTSAFQRFLSARQRAFPLSQR